MNAFRSPEERAAHSAERAAALHSHIFSLPNAQFQGKPWALIDAIDEFAKTQGLPLIFHQNKIQLAHDAIAKMEPSPKMVVEFGTFVGTSALAWGATLRELNKGDEAGIRVYALELDSKYAEIARDFIELTGLEHVVTVVEGTASESLKKLHTEGQVVPGKVDVVFLDHWKDVYLPDLKLVEELKLFHTGSIIIADNTDFPGAPDYVEYIKKGGSGESGAVRYETETLEVVGQQRGPKIVEVTTVVSTT